MLSEKFLCITIVATRFCKALVGFSCSTWCYVNTIINCIIHNCSRSIYNSAILINIIK